MTATATTDADVYVSRLYAQYAPQISAYAHRRAPSHDAPDVVAETFLTAWRRRDDIPAEPHTLPWLYGVARRVLANQRRGAGRRDRLHDRLIIEPAPMHQPVCRLETRERFTHVATALHELSETDAELIRLTAWEGLSPAEVALSMGIEPNAARQRLHRARGRLQAVLDRDDRSTRLTRVVVVVVAAVLSAAALVASGLLSTNAIVETDPIGERNSSLPAPARSVVEPKRDVVTTIADATRPTESVVSPPPTVPTAASTPTVEPEVTVTTAPTTTVAVTSAAPTTVVPTSAPSAATPTTTSAAVGVAINGPFAAGRDRLVVHLDFAHLDDGHSAVANAELAAHFGLSTLVVAGTQTSGGDNFTHPYTDVLNAAYGGAWLDASRNRSGVVTRAADLWLSTIDSDGVVWIAEGGVSDFSAEVLREIADRRPDLVDSGRLANTVRIIQHNDRNEQETQPDDLAAVRSLSTYERIDDGNNTNATAKLTGADQSFETLSETGSFSVAWSIAFGAMGASELDFSDTVGVLHIVGIGLDEVSTAGDFAASFMSRQ